MKILGINLFHANSSIALIIDGVLVYAIEEERLNRIKNSGGFPYLAIISALKYASLKLNDLDCVAVNRNPNAEIFNRLKFALSNIIRPTEILKKLSTINSKTNIAKEINSIKNFGFFEGKVYNIEHHLAHIASAYYQSGFDSACSVSVDGSGDFTTTSNATCIDNSIEFNNRILYPHSLGILYSAITNYLGFKNYGDEYKVMGMSAYGEKKLNNKIEELVMPDGNNFKLNLNYFLHHKKFNTFKIKNMKNTFLNILILVLNLMEQKIYVSQVDAL